jgi:glycosyltransferase involved in cell wall biosynthesis
MLHRIKQRLFSSITNKKLLEAIYANLKIIRAHSNTVALYGSPTANNWLGVANITTNVYKNTALEIPQTYSNPVLSSEQIKAVCQQIKDLKFDKVIISGFAPYFFEFIDILYDSCRIQILFQGTISEFHSPGTQNLIQSIIKYGKEGKIHHMSFLKLGLEKVFHDLYGFETSHQAPDLPLIPGNIKLIEIDPTKVHIGVFGWDTFNKNLHNQVIYSLLNPNTVIHVLDKSMFDYLELGDRIIGYGGNLPKEKFLSILGAMDLNLYMSYSESWGLVAYESEAMGVACLRMDDIDYRSKIKAAIGSKAR